VIQDILHTFKGYQCFSQHTKEYWRVFDILLQLLKDSTSSKLPYKHIVPSALLWVGFTCIYLTKHRGTDFDGQ